MGYSKPTYEELLTIFENTSDGICVTTPEHVIRHVNASFEDLSGFTRDELVGRSFEMLVPPEGREDLAVFRREMGKTGQVRLETVGRNKAGNIIPAEVSGRVSSYHGQPVWVHVISDIAPRYHAQEELRSSRERLQLVVQQSPNAIITWDKEFKVSEWNLAAEKIFGHSNGEAVGQHARFIVPVAVWDHVDEIWQGLMEMSGGMRSTNENITKSGDSIRCEWYNTTLVDDSGEAIGVLSVVEDVTEKKQLEEERERLLMAIEQSEDAIVMTDNEGKLNYVNPAFERISGYSSAEALGQNPSIQKSGRHDEEFYRQMWKTITDGKTWRGDIINKRKDGALVTEYMTISPLLNEAGKIINFVAVKRVVTKLRSIQEQLRQSQKMEAVGRLAGGVAHDFNNMLNVILGYTDLIMSDLNPHDPIREQLNEIHNAAQRSADLTKQLLAFSRKQIIEPKVVSLNDIVANMEKTLRRLISEDIDLEFLAGADLGNIRIDPSQVDQILANLVVNARDAMPQGGRLVLETNEVTLDEAYCEEKFGAYTGRFVVLSVSDTGSGMTKETLDAIFEPFFTSKKEGEGTGLGLSTVKGIVEQNQGFIHVYSEPDQGTTFRIYLPLCDESLTEEETKTHRSLVGGEGTILMVEDDSMLRTLTKNMLKRLGYTVLSADLPSTAQSLFERYLEEIDLLLTDVVLPEMSGRDLYNQLVAARPDLRVLYTSGYTANVISHQGVLEEGVEFIPKPFSLDELAAKVRIAIAGR